jgi:hypothetical protein
MKEFGAVITFPAGTTEEQAERWLSELSEKVGHVMGYPVQVQGPYDFKPEWGGPVWYIP